MLVTSRLIYEIHPGLVALPGSGAVLQTPVAAPSVAASSLTGAPGGRVERGSATAFFLLSITKRIEDTGTRRPNASGRNAIVWKVKA